MKAYGFNASRGDRSASHTGTRPGNRKTTSRRIDNKTTRAKGKAQLREEVSP